MTDLESSNLSIYFKVMISLKYLQEKGRQRRKIRQHFCAKSQSLGQIKGDIALFLIGCNKKSNFYGHFQGFRFNFVISINVKGGHTSKAQ